MGEDDVELIYAKQGLGLSEHSETRCKRSAILCTLQHLSQKPYLNLSLAENELMNYMPEWDLLTADMVLPNIQFLHELRCVENGDPARRNWNGLLNLVKKYFNKEFHVIVDKFENGAFETTNLFSTSPTSKQSGEKIRLFHDKNDNIFRLICAKRALHPQPIALAEELINQLLRWKIIQFLLESDDAKLEIDLKNDSSHSEIFGKLHHLSESLQRTTSFSEIFDVIPSQEAVREEYASILQQLISVEREIPIVDQASLRVKLISLIYTEMFLPLRTVILEEKEKQERVAIQNAERRQRLVTHAQNLQNELVQGDTKLQELEADIKRAKEANESVLGEKEKELQKLKERLQAQKEEEAFIQLLNFIYTFQPSSEVIEKLVRLRDTFSKFTLEKMVKNFQSIYNRPKSPLLEDRIKRNVEADREQLIHAFELVVQSPIVRQDSQKVLSVHGVHVILSTVLHQIHDCLKNNSSIEEIRFHITGTLVLDTNLKKKYFSGKNIIMVAQNLVVGESSVKIDVSGRHAVSSFDGKARNGVNDGGNGDDGVQGRAGKNGGSVYIEALSSEISNYNHLKIKVNGGNGENGQDGGNGKDGRNGEKGTDGKWDGPVWPVFAYYEIKKGSKGRPGQAGGIGGAGGLGGEGGKPGRVDIIPARCKSDDNISATKGKRGTDGKPGRNARSGQAGRDGMDFGWAKNGASSFSYSKEGYNLSVEEIWWWKIFQRYEFHVGDQVYQSQTQQVSTVYSRQSQAARNRSGDLKAINSSDIAQVRAAVKTGVLGKVEQNESSIASTEKEALDLQAEIKKNASRAQVEMETKMAQKNETQKIQRQMEQQLSRSNAKSGEAEKEELQALSLAETYSKLDKEVAAQHQMANRKLAMSQQQIVFEAQQTKTTTTLRAAAASADETPSGELIGKAKDSGGLTGRMCGNVEEDRCYSLFSALEKKFPRNEKLIQVEEFLQRIILQLGEIPKIYEQVVQEFLSSNILSRKEPSAKLEKYLTENFMSDLLVCYEFEALPKTIQFLKSAPRFTTLFQLVLHHRITTRNQDEQETLGWTDLKLPKNIKESDMSKELENEETFKEICDQIKAQGQAASTAGSGNSSKDKKSMFKNPFGKREPLAWKLPVHEQVLELGRQLYIELGNNFGELGFKEPMLEFLYRFCSEVTMQADGSGVDSEAVGKFLQKIDLLSLKLIKKTLEASDPSPVAEKYLESLPLVIHMLNFSSDESQKILDATTGGKHPKIREAILRNFRAGTEKKFQDSFARLRTTSRIHFQRFVELVDSEALNLRLEDRTKHYTALSKRKDVTTSEEALKLATVQLYVDLTGGTVGTTTSSSFDIQKFLDQLDKKKLDKFELILENGKVVNKEIVPFTTAELAKCENFVSSKILRTNETLAFELLEIISSKTFFEKKLLCQKFDPQGIHGVTDEILKRIEDFCKEAEKAEGCNVTDFVRTKKYVKFSLARIQLLLAKIGKCDRMTHLKGQLEMDENLAGMIATLDQFYDEHKEYFRPQFVQIHAENIPALISEVGDLLEEKKIRQQPTDAGNPENLQENKEDEKYEPATVAELEELFLQILELIKFSNEPQTGDSLETLAVFKRRIAIWCGREATWLKYLLSCLDSAAGLADYPTGFVQERFRYFQCCLIQLEEFLNFCQLQVDKLKDSKLFVVSTFVNELSESVLTSELLDPSNFNLKEARDKVDELVKKLCSVKMEDPVGVQNRKYSLWLESARFPLYQELILVLKTCHQSSSSQNEILKSFFNYANDPKNGKKEMEQVIRDATKIFQEFTSNKGRYKALSSIFLKHIDDRLLSRLVLRLFRNLQDGATDLNSTQLKSIYTMNQGVQPITASHFMKSLMTSSELKNLHVFATAQEIQLIGIIFNFKSQLSQEDLVGRVENVLYSSIPEHWKSKFEKILLELNVERFLALTASLSQEDTFVKTFKLRMSSGIKKKAMRIFQRFNLGLTFETAYFFIRPSQRLDWFLLLDVIYKSAQTQSVSMFSSSRDCIKFLKLSMDLNFERFRDIIKSKFPFHWMKWMLIEYFDETLKRSGSDEKDVENIRQLIAKFLSSDASPSKLSFLFVLRERLLAEKQNSMFDENWVDLKRLKKILGRINELNLTRNDIAIYRPLLLTSPLPYWPKILRLAKFQKQFQSSSRKSYKFLAMDEKFGEHLVDALVSKVPQLNQLTETHLDYILLKFLNGEWVLDQQNIKNLEKILSKELLCFESYGEMVQYSDKKRSKPLEIGDLIEECATHPLNGDEKAATVQNIHSLLVKILDLLNSHYPVREGVDSYGQFESKVKEWIQNSNTAAIEEGFLPYAAQVVSTMQKMIEKTPTPPLVKWSSNEKLDQDFVCNLICVIYRGIQFHFVTEAWEKFHTETKQVKSKDWIIPEETKKPRLAQLVSLLFLISGRNEGGKMGEIDTGEGKSLIVAMFAVFTALLSARIHVITSNEVLAKTGAEEFEEFYKLFRLSVSNNCDDKIKSGSESDKRKRYNCHIVYGDIGSFQADHLYTHFYDKKIIESKADVVIVDEVDSLLLDKASNMLYLSHSIPDMKHLRPVFLIIWEAVQRRIKAQDDRKKLEEKIKREKAIFDEESKMVEKPKMAEKSKVDEKPKMAEKSKVDEKPKMAEKSKVDEKPKMAEKSKVDEKPKMAEKSKVDEKPKMAEKSKVDEKPKIAEKSKVDEKPKIAEKSKVDEKPKIAEKSKVDEKPKLAEKSKLDDKKKVENSPQFTESDVNSVMEGVLKRLTEERQILKIPQCLNDFILRRLGIWVKQAFRAHFMPLNENFIVGQSSTTRIINMDNSTGVEQANMHLQLGLQQFLQLRYLAKLTPETLKCVYISNTEYLDDYKKKGRIFGITGTLGDEEERDILTNAYGTTFFGMPKFQPGRRIEFPASIAREESAWLANICDSIQAHPNQPILIISENIATLQKIMDYVKAQEQLALAGRFTKIHSYKSSVEDVKVTDEIAGRGGLCSDELVGSTNLGGRGTDFKINKKIKEGLHVILSYLPSNLRIQKQAFGRAARAGEAGSVQFVVMETEADPTESIEELLERRNVREMHRLSTVKRESNRIKLEDKLFSKYRDYFRSIRGSSSLKRYAKRIRNQQLEFLNNRWALWLDSIRENLELLHLRGDGGKDAILAKFDSFKSDMNSKLYSTRDACCFGEFPSELTKLGIHYEKVGTRTLLGSLKECAFENAGEILEDTWDKVKEGFNIVGAAVTFDLETLGKVSTEKGERHKMETERKLLGSDLDIGINLLQTVCEQDASLSDAATAYLATLNIAKNSTARKTAKGFLTSAREKLLGTIEHNMSCVQLLQDATSQLQCASPENTNRPNCFKLQMDSESSIYQFHIAAIDGALQLPLSPALFKTRMVIIDLSEEGKAIYQEILKNGKFVKPRRVSKKISQEQWVQLKSKMLAVEMDSLVEQLEKPRALNSNLNEDSFGNLIVTKQKFVAELVAAKLVRETKKDGKTYVVSIDAQRYVDFKKNWPSDFDPNLESIVKVQLYRQMGLVYNGMEMFTDSKVPPTIDLARLETFLIEQKCIQLAPFHHGARVEIVKENIVIDNDKEVDVPGGSRTLTQFKKLLRPLLLDANGEARAEFIMSEIPLPSTAQEGSNAIFKCLTELKIVREPTLKFKRQLDHSTTQTQIENVKKWLKEMRPSFKTVCLKYHPKITADKDIDAYVDGITAAVLDSIGSIKKYSRLKVVYKDLMSEMLQAQSEPSEELSEFMREGLLAEIFTLEECVLWYENTGALLIMALGAAEIGLGVAIEFVSVGTLSPLAGFLISEGGSDLFYSMKQLYHGQRVDGAHYKRYKVESMVTSVCTCWIPGAGGAIGGTLKDFAVATGKVLFRELAKAGGKALLYGFIEENMQKAVEKNLGGVNSLLDSMMESAEFKRQLELIKKNARSLHAASFEEDQAEDYVRKLFSSVDGTEIENAASSFKVRLQHSGKRVINRIIIDVTKDFTKRTMPISYGNLAGLFGFATQSIKNSKEEIEAFVLETLHSFNGQMQEKIVEYIQLQKETFHGDIRSGVDDFEAFVIAALAELKMNFRKAIMDYLYQQLCLPSVKLRIHKSVTVGYSRLTIKEEQFLATTVEDSHIAGIHESKDGGAAGTDDSWARIVRNANGRTRKEVVTSVGEKALKESKVKYLGRTDFSKLTDKELESILGNPKDAATLKKVMEKETKVQNTEDTGPLREKLEKDKKIDREQFMFLVGGYKVKFYSNNFEEDFMSLVEDDREIERFEMSCDEKGFEEYLAFKEKFKS